MLCSVDGEVVLFMLRRFVVVVAMSLSMGPSAVASLFDAPQTGETEWSELSAEGIHCGANHANRKTRIAYENSESSEVTHSDVASHGKSSGVRAQ